MANVSERNRNLLFIGGGNIAGAVACGLAHSGVIPPSNITVYDIDDSKFNKFTQCGINVSSSLSSASVDADFVFIAVKPNVVGTVMRQLSEIDGLLDRAVVVSFAAAVPTEFIEQNACKDLKVIRTMPSTPILVGEGVIAVSKNERVSKKDFEYLCRLMSAIAHVEVTTEDMLNPIISVSGSSPAYVYLFIKSMLDASEKLGVDRKTALPLILKTVKGSVTMIEKSDVSIEQLIANVTSPNGTTLAALNSFKADDFAGTVERAMFACAKRTDEISKEL